MLTQTQIERMLDKLRRFEETLDGLLFEKTAELDVCAFETGEQYHKIPNIEMFSPIRKGWKWGAEGHYCWFLTQYKVPAALEGKDIFIRPRIDGYEAMLWVNGIPFGTFNTKIVFTAHGNHYCDLLLSNAKSGQNVDIAIEYYAGHYFKGTRSLSDNAPLDYDYSFSSVDICVKNKEINEFLFDLHTMNSLVTSLPGDSFRRGELINELYDIHKLVYYSYDDCTPAEFMNGLALAQPILKKALSMKNGPEAPFAGLIGHSHMDTAWLWHVDETVKKCARTYSNQMSLMEQYPEYTFMQSSACHSDMILRNYPELFKKIQEKVSEGRYEPNGGVWVECDCNITSGESMIRQFLWGQRFTQKHFNYTSNCFWLPDTFGYSAAIPQIMKGCEVDYFLTTKIGWNDTNAFPYDTFYWQGIDGTKVFSHFNVTHCETDPQALIDSLTKGYGYESNQEIARYRETSVTNQRLVAYGYGDGGGGPQFEFIELARRAEDLNGCPKSKHVLVGEFMKELEKSVMNPTTFRGELYLEIHRGTLTNQHEIKRNNRKAELKLRDAEFFIVNDAVKKSEAALNTKTEPLYRLLLINQFHDILPGTCIPKAHIQAIKETAYIIDTADKYIKEIASTDKAMIVTVTNTLSFERKDTVFLDYREGLIANSSYKQQIYTDLDGNKKLMVSGITVPAFSSITLELNEGKPISSGCFDVSENEIKTPFAAVKFDEKGRISSLVDLSINRELVDSEGYAFNTFLIAEDLPSCWDAWDVDADLECKFADTSELLSREIISNGEVAVIIRSKYKISEKSSVTQDMFFFADTAEIRFDTLMDWNDDHRFLKTAFDTTVYEDFIRNEIQFGYLKRQTTRNTSVEKAKFEILNHKYSDFSEQSYGITLLNDCKYGLSVEGSSMKLSLHKGGNRPDYRGDKGMHRCVYSIVPHNCGFSANAVIKPSYEFNVPHVVTDGEYKSIPLMTIDKDNIIVEAIKPCEDCENAFIARLYEAEGSYTPAKIELFDRAVKVDITNMLEKVTDSADVKNLNLTFKPFEIKTLKVTY